MMKTKLNSYKLVACFTKAFFEAFTTGLIDTEHGHTLSKDDKAIAIKQAVAQHTEAFSGAYFDLLFHTITQFNYKDIDKVERELQTKFKDQQPDLQAYLQFACKTSKLYEALITSYQTNFSLLLSGKFQTMPYFLSHYPKGLQLAMIDEPQALMLLTRLIIRAYAMGLNQQKDASSSFAQQSVYSLLLVNIHLLRNETNATFDTEDLQEAFKTVCGSETNFNVMVNTMQETFQELTQ